MYSPSWAVHHFLFVILMYLNILIYILNVLKFYVFLLLKYYDCKFMYFSLWLRGEFLIKYTRNYYMYIDSPTATSLIHADVLRLWFVEHEKEHMISSINLYQRRLTLFMWLSKADVRSIITSINFGHEHDIWTQSPRIH